MAENPQTITASATTATSGTATFQPNLHPPIATGSGTPNGVVEDPAGSTTAQINLFTTSGIGSTGTVPFGEAGWTNDPYDHQLSVLAGTDTCSNGGPLLTTVATVTAGSNGATQATPITATVVASPTAGDCSISVGDGLSSNTTDAVATLTVTYTTAGIGVNGHRRK